MPVFCRPQNSALLEGGIRIPAIISYPGKFWQGSSAVSGRVGRLVPTFGLNL